MPALLSIKIAFIRLKQFSVYQGSGRTNTALAFCLIGFCYLGLKGLGLSKVEEAPEIDKTTEVAAEPEAPTQEEPQNMADTLPISAPEGVFFLRVYKSLETDNGIIGIAPGTRLMRIDATNDLLLVKSDDQEFVVTRDEVTNNLKEASLIIRSDRHAQAQFAEQTKQGLAEREEQKRQYWEQYELRRQREYAAVNRSYTPRAYTSPLSEGSKPVHFRWNTGSGRRASVFSEEETTKRQLNDLRQAQEAALRSQIESIKRQEQQMTTQELLRSRTISERIEMEQALKQLRRNQ